MIEGLRVALDLARNQRAYRHRRELADDNPEQYEDGIARMTLDVLVTRLEAALAEAQRREP